MNEYMLERDPAQKSRLWSQMALGSNQDNSLYVTLGKLHYLSEPLAAKHEKFVSTLQKSNLERIK